MNITNDMERLNGNTSGSSRPSLPVQLLPETVQQPDRDREVVAPVASTSIGCAGAGSVSRQESNEPFVEIVEQPMSRRRFRYYSRSEIYSAGGIQGVNSTKDKKSFPKIKIGNYVGPAEITASLVCKNTPYRVHPYGIVSKNNSTKEHFAYVKQVRVTRNKCVVQFDDLGIGRVKSDEIKEALRLREDQNFDPFGQGFCHEFDPKVDDLLAVRLCFQVKLAQELKLHPVVSVVIYHTTNIGCLQIDRVIVMCRCCASNTDEPQTVIFISRSRLNPKDVEVVFYKEENEEVWEYCVTEFEICDTRGIVCAVPPYPRASIEYDTVVNVVLRRPSDGTCGDPKPFTYFSDADAINERKRKKANNILQNFVKNSKLNVWRPWRPVEDELAYAVDWTPPASLPPDNDSQYDQDWRKIPQLSHVNSAVPRPSHGNSPLPGSSFINQDVLQWSHANQAMPGPSSANAGVLGPSHVNSPVPGPNHGNSPLPGSSFINQDVSQWSHTNQAMPNHGLNHVKSAVPKPDFASTAVPGLNYVNSFSPELIEWEHTETNISTSMSPDMAPMPSISQPMSGTVDEGFFNVEELLRNDGEYPGDDSALAAICYDLINLD